MMSPAASENTHAEGSTVWLWLSPQVWRAPKSIGWERRGQGRGHYLPFTTLLLPAPIKGLGTQIKQWMGKMGSGGGIQGTGRPPPQQPRRTDSVEHHCSFSPLQLIALLDASLPPAWGNHSSDWDLKTRRCASQRSPTASAWPPCAAKGGGGGVGRPGLSRGSL
jgi:hypothetical protein